jgi:hypothetical protein
VLNGEGAPPCKPGGTCTILPSIAVNGDDVTISNSEITNHNTAICINAGYYRTERAVRLTVRGNRIHHCGRLPPTNYDHGVYLGRTDHATVTDNLIYANADRGVQFYPEANHSYVKRNVIDGNGTGVRFGGASDAASSDNVVEHNLITNSKKVNVSSSYAAGNPVGDRNVARSNCIHGAGQFDAYPTPTVGFTVENNLFVDPKYVDRASGNFELHADDPCHSVLAGQDPAGSDDTSGGSGTGSGGDSSTDTGAGDSGDTGTVDTEITEKPNKKTKRKIARFSFKATTGSRSRAASRTVTSASFKCKLDRRQWKSCTSPTRYKVRRGKHRFRVRARDTHSNAVDRKPARRAWKVKGRRR